MRRRLSAIFAVMLWFSLAALGQVEVEGVGRIHSLESLGDSGELLFRGTPAGKDEAFVGGYGFSLGTGRSVCLVPCEPTPNPMQWSWRVLRMGHGLEDGVAWGLRREPTDATGVNWVMRLLRGSGEEMQGSLGAQTWRELWFRPSKGEEEELLIYRGAGERLLTRMLSSEGVTDREGEALPEDTGMRAILVSDGEFLVYLSQEEQSQNGLRRQNLATGENELVELLGRRQELGVFNGEYLSSFHWIAASSSGNALAYPAVDGARGMRLRLATREPGAATWQWSWVSSGKALEPTFSQDGRLLLFRTETSLCLLDRRDDTLQTLADNVAFPETTAQTGPHCLLSPNGRYAAWLDKEGQLFFLDLGPRIGVTESVVRIPTRGEGDMGIQLGGARDSTCLRWELPEGVETVDFLVVSQVTGETIPAGEEMPWETLPWSVVAKEGAAAGEVTLRLLLDSGDACSLTIRITDFQGLTEYLAPSLNVYRYPSLFFPQDGQVQTVTDAPLAGNTSGQALYGRETTRSSLWTRLSGEDEVAFAQGCPLASFWIRKQDGALFRDDTCVDASAHLQTAGALAVSRCGAVAALLATGELRFSPDGGDTWETLSASADSPFLSAAGTTVIWREGAKLMGRLGGAGVQPSVLTSHSVAALLGMTHEGGKILFRGEDGVFRLLQAPFSSSPQISVLALPEDASQVCLSANGRRLAFLYVPAGETVQRIGVWDLLADSPEVRCLTPEAVLPPGALAISPSGRQIAFSSCADMETEGGKTPAENGHWNLHLWNDPLWANDAPQFPVTSLNSLEEDGTETNLRLTPLLDADGDAVALWTVTPPAHGTLRTAPPDTRLSFPRVYYQGDPDFNGTDVFALCLFDGEREVVKTWNLTVTPVNDAPAWPGDLPQTLALTGGEERQLTLAAQDPDLEDASPDSLTYSLEAGAPSWAEVGQENTSQGWLRLAPPMNTLPGEYPLSVRVTDQAGETATWNLLLQIQSLPEVTVSVALLRDASQAPQAPATVQEKMLASLAGCWQEIPLGGYSALSLPGDVSLAALRQALDVEVLYVYDGGAFVPLRGEGVLPGGTGFWAMPGPALDDAEVSLVLTPSCQRPAGLPFTGPLLGEEAPPGGGAWNPASEGWRREGAWQMGHGYFLEEPAP
ncbi:MAG: hypothetical protein ACI4SG_02760 [Oligosphaeraceae bacterium]